LAAALALLFLAGRLVTDLRERLQLAEGRAAAAESALGTATTQAATAIAALATSTAAPRARVDEARAAVEQILATTLEAYRDPSPERVAAVTQLYAPQPLSEITPEIDRLRSQGLHLGGRSGYQLEIPSADTLGEDRALVRTRELWTYDELNAQDETVRCVQETYTASYLMQRQQDTWRIEELRLEEPTSRQDCQ
jgi:hypothetical protein